MRFIFFLDQWLFLCTCLFDVLQQWNFILPSKPVLFKAINYHAIITRACSFGWTACAHLLFRVYTNYVITSSRAGTGIDGTSLCWVSKGMHGKRWSPGGIGIAKAVARQHWLLGAGSVGKLLWQRCAGGGCWSRRRNSQRSAYFCARGFTPFPPPLLWWWGPMSLRNCLLCNLKVFKRAVRQTLSHSAGNPKQDGQRVASGDPPPPISLKGKWDRGNNRLVRSHTGSSCKAER